MERIEKWKLHGAAPASNMYMEGDAIGCPMLLRMNRDFVMENPRNYPEQVTERVRRALMDGREAQADPHRPDFCEIEDDGCSYYLYVSPISGQVTLVAQWSRAGVSCRQQTGQAA